MTRTENIKKNLTFNIIKFVAQLVLQFLLRTVLIRLMGAEYIGLNGLFTNIFSFLNLAELGIGTAIVFSMYKPIADGDIEKVKSLQSLYKKFYLTIASIVLAVGLCILPFLEFFISGDVNIDINIYALYVLYLINTLVGYLAAHKRSLLFAYQRNDIENKIKTICLFGMTILQIIILFLFKNYYLYFLITILFTIIECILIYVLANKMFPTIKGRPKRLDGKTKKEISKNVAALSLHKVSTIVVSSTDNIIISTILGIVILGVYSNYFLIVSSLVAFFYVISHSISGSVGNLVASTNNEYAYNRYKIINFVFSFLSAFSTICMIVLFQPFMQVWTGGGIYLLDISTVILICVSFYLNRMRSSISIFKEATGLFWQYRFAPLFEAGINLVVSIGLGLVWGINGIIIGTILSTVLVPLWVEPKVLYKHYFKKSVWIYFKRYIIDVLIMVFVGFISFFICSFIPDVGIWWLIAKFAVCGILTLGLLILAYLPTKEFKECFKMVNGFISKLFSKRKKQIVNFKENGENLSQVNEDINTIEKN